MSSSAEEPDHGADPTTDSTADATPDEDDSTPAPLPAPKFVSSTIPAEEGGLDPSVITSASGLVTEGAVTTLAPSIGSGIGGISSGIGGIGDVAKLMEESTAGLGSVLARAQNLLARPISPTVAEREGPSQFSQDLEELTSGLDNFIREKKGIGRGRRSFWWF